MTITQTYRLVHSARGKLSKEAQRGEYDLRLLVGHANLLDSLMLELETAEDEQEQWFNNTVTVAAKEEPKHVTFSEVEYPESSDSSDEDDGELSSDEEFQEVGTVDMVPLRTTSPKQSQRLISVHEFAIQGSDSEEEDDQDTEDDDMSDDEDANNASLSLCRTVSRSESSQNPPELVSDSEDSDDDSLPLATPPQQQQAALDFTGAQSNFALVQQKTVDDDDAEAALFEDGFYIPNHHRQSTMIAAC